VVHQPIAERAKVLDLLGRHPRSRCDGGQWQLLQHPCQGERGESPVLPRRIDEAPFQARSRIHERLDVFEVANLRTAQQSTELVDENLVLTIDGERHVPDANLSRRIDHRGRVGDEGDEAARVAVADLKTVE
jgi:hypothetical protein